MPEGIYKTRPKSEAAERIEAYIQQNHLHAHDRLPSERDMCALWGVSRTSVIRAIHRLVNDGILYSRVGSGTFVAPAKIRRCLQRYEPFPRAAQQAGYAFSTQVLQSRVIEAPRYVCSKLRVRLGHPVFMISRLRSLDGVPFMLDTSYIDAQRFPGIEAHDYGTESLYGILDGQFHAVVTHGQERFSLTYAMEDEAALLQVPTDTALFLVDSVGLDSEETTVEYAKLLILPRSVQYYSELTR